MEIVTAGILEKNGRFLLAKRKPEKKFGGKWEFPGGKLEFGETPEQCLERELNEELGIEVEVGNFIASSVFEANGKQLHLQAYQIISYSGEMNLVDHTEIQWVTPNELLKYELTPADIPIAKIIFEKCLTLIKK